jgi:predicted DNA-binding transcriptional regulator AlpA
MSAIDNGTGAVRYLTLEELKAKYKVCRSTVYEWMGQGLPYSKIGRVVRYPEGAVEEWVRSRTIGLKIHERKQAA